MTVNDTGWKDQPLWGKILGLISCPVVFGLVSMAANSREISTEQMTTSEAFLFGFVGWFVAIAIIGVLAILLPGKRRA
ncbi:MAG: hypothetical protein AB203_00150 [Parcubacteria bacterium C7867-008]|nr:MAG: hypothetical protein AB203_00150 [Parcubacteria bacterium C7867-008]